MDRMHMDVVGDATEILALGASLVRARGGDIDWDVPARAKGKRLPDHRHADNGAIGIVEAGRGGRSGSPCDWKALTVVIIDNFRYGTPVIVATPSAAPSSTCARARWSATQ
jgi:hypothetical protein